MKRFALALAFHAFPAAAHEVRTGTLVIDHPYALETPATAFSGAGYMTITNTGGDPDRLLAVRADFPA
jgi:copper(I)-binding protein